MRIPGYDISVTNKRKKNKETFVFGSLFFSRFSQRLFRAREHPRARHTETRVSPAGRRHSGVRVRTRAPTEVVTLARARVVRCAAASTARASTRPETLSRRGPPSRRLHVPRLRPWFDSGASPWRTSPSTARTPRSSARSGGTGTASRRARSTPT